MSGGDTVIASLLVATGVVAAGVGVSVARGALQTAGRTYQKLAARCAAAAEGWGAWFVSGFSDVTMGLCWVYALAAWLAWTLAGLSLIGAGVRLLHGSRAL